MHATRGGNDDGGDYKRAYNYFSTPNAVSAHRVVGRNEGEHCQCLDDDSYGWHAREDGMDSVGIEFVQEVPTIPYSDYQLRVGIALCVYFCTKYGIEPTADTIIPHSASPCGKADKKSDPGDLFPLEELIRRVRATMRLPA